jgi:hypothetical protein
MPETGDQRRPARPRPADRILEGEATAAREDAQMLSRYTIYRRRPADAGPLPNGIRQDTRYRTSHILRPTAEIVDAYLSNPTDAAWRRFKRDYLALLETRFRADRQPFDELAGLAGSEDVYLGCNCPTKKNPTHGCCHTYLALEFMEKKYPTLEVVALARPVAAG